jgi:hypoxanthine phosphoribosyltransferase
MSGMADDISRVLISKEEIAGKVRDLGQRLSKEYGDKNPLMVCVLKGSTIFYADLVRQMDIPIQMDFIAVSSYGRHTSSSGEVRLNKDLDQSLEGRHVVVVEDILDTGLTLHYLTDMLRSRQPASLKICTLLDKPERRSVAIEPDFCGFTVPDEFVVGYGLDYAERYRNLPYIGVLKESVYKK